jgi:hypothetical protein
MYQMLRNIATEFEDLLLIGAIVFPYRKIANEPQIVLKPAGTSVFLRGQSNSPQGFYNAMTDAEMFYGFTIQLHALGSSEELVESFYAANEKCDKLFSKRIGMMVVNSKPSVSVELKKKVGQGIYGQVIDGQDLGNGVFEFSEIWDGTIKILTYI